MQGLSIFGDEARQMLQSVRSGKQQRDQKHNRTRDFIALAIRFRLRYPPNTHNFTSSEESEETEGHPTDLASLADAVRRFLKASVRSFPLVRLRLATLIAKVGVITRWFRKWRHTRNSCLEQVLEHWNRVEEQERTEKQKKLYKDIRLRRDQMSPAIQSYMKLYSTDDAKMTAIATSYWRRRHAFRLKLHSWFVALKRVEMEKANLVRRGPSTTANTVMTSMERMEKIEGLSAEIEQIQRQKPYFGWKIGSFSLAELKALLQQSPMGSPGGSPPHSRPSSPTHPELCLESFTINTSSSSAVTEATFPTRELTLTDFRSYSSLSISSDGEELNGWVVPVPSQPPPSGSASASTTSLLPALTSHASERFLTVGSVSSPKALAHSISMGQLNRPGSPTSTLLSPLSSPHGSLRRNRSADVQQLLSQSPPASPKSHREGGRSARAPSPKTCRTSPPLSLTSPLSPLSKGPSQDSPVPLKTPKTPSPTLTDSSPLGSSGSLLSLPRLTTHPQPLSPFLGDRPVSRASGHNNHNSSASISPPSPSFSASRSAEGLSSLVREKRLFSPKFAKSRSAVIDTHNLK